MRHCRRSLLGPLLLFFLLAVVLLAPLASPLLVSGGGDLAAHVSGIVEATRALREGQFPLRVAPWQLDGSRYPFFSYYGNLPYTVGGLLCVGLRVDPYTAWKLVNLISLTLGAFYAFRCAETLTRRTLPSIIGGVVFLFAPYMWTDVHVRWAFTETVSFALLPVVLFYALRAFASRGLGYVLLSGVAWSLLALSHNITYLYASALFGVFFLSCLRLAAGWRGLRASARRLCRVGFGYALGVLLTLWFLVPQFATIDDLVIKDLLAAPVGGDFLAPLSVLMSPVLRSPPASSTPDLGIQVGWPILAGVLLAGAALVARKRLSAGAAGHLPRMLAFFALVLVLVAMPSAWWKSIPTVFYVVQSSYRLLMFVVLAGALLTSLGFAAWFCRGGRTMSLAHVLGATALVAVSCLSYVPRHAGLAPGALTELVERPDLGGSGAATNYQLSQAAAARTSWSHADVNYAEPLHGLIKEGWLALNVSLQPLVSYVPRSAVRPGGAMVVEGDVPGDAGPMPLKLSAMLGEVATPQIELKPGEPFRVAFPVPSKVLRGRDPLRVSLHCDRYPFRDGHLALRVNRVHFTSPRPEECRFVPAGEMRRSSRYGRRSKFVVAALEPALVQLPVLYYPAGLVRVQENGREIPCGNVGRYVAVRLAPGRHRLRVSYAGVPWANVSSGAVWTGVAVGAVVLFRRRGRRRRPKSTRAALVAPAFSVRSALLCFATAGIVFAAIPICRQVQRSLRHDMPVTVFASHKQGDAFPPENAFDGNPATVWAAPGEVEEVVLTVVPTRPARCYKAVLESRITGLYETWQELRVHFYRNGIKTSEQAFRLTEAATQPSSEVVFQPVEADRIEFRFSSPVCVTRDGGTRVPPAATAPGYREIRLTWER